MIDELPDVQPGFRKHRGTLDQTTDICWIIRKARKFQKKHLILLYWLCQSLWLWGSQQTVENSSRDENTKSPDLHSEKPVCRSKTTVNTRHETTDWLQFGKGVCQGCILSLCLFNLHAKYIMRNAGLDEAQAGIKISGRNINNLRYADDTTLFQKAKKN